MPYQIKSDSRQKREEVVDRWFTGTAASYDQVVRATTLGLDGYWKRELLSLLPAEPNSILDLACGTGIVLMMLADRYPAARLVGVDITPEYLEVAREKARRRGADWELLLTNAETMELEGKFDAVCSSYIPKYVDPDKLLPRITPHLAPGAIVAFHDFTAPRGGLSKIIWRIHMALVNRLGRKVYPAWDKCLDAELESMILKTRWPRRYEQAFARYGFTDIQIRPLSFRTATTIVAKWAG